MTVINIPTQQIEPPNYSAAEVCQYANITYRQLDYWLRTGAIEVSFNPQPGSGMPRRFSLEEAQRIQLLGRLVHAGLKIEYAASAVRRLHDRQVELTPGVRLVLDD